MTGGAWRLGHRPALDGLRGIAVLLVIAEHFGFAPRGTGSAGVTLFFTLSGFLITRVIVEAREDGRWSYRSFLAARFVRLFPALALMVAVVSSAMLAIGLTFDRRAVAVLLYMGNFMQPGSPFDHAWSLAVEEQFYLLWPLAVPLALGTRRPVRWIGVVALVSTLARFTLAGSDFYAAYRSLPTNAFALLAGCALALAAPRLPALSHRALLASVAGVALIAWPVGSFVAVPVVAAILAVPAVWGAVSESSAPRPLRFVGRISYAWYLWHYPVVVLAGLDAGGWGEVAGAVATLAVAVGSTLLIEEPLRRAWRVRSAEVLTSHVSAGDVEADARVVVDGTLDIVAGRQVEINGGVHH